jgi:hypothetical protein
VLERLELCHRTVLVDGGEAYMFPGAISAASGRPPDVMQWMGARHFCAGRQFELAPDVSSTLIFRPGLVPALQCWALRHYPGSTLWAGGVHIGLGVTRGTAVEGAEAAVQLHCHAGAEMRDAARGSDPGDHMVVVIVRSRGDDEGCAVPRARCCSTSCATRCGVSQGCTVTRRWWRGGCHRWRLPSDCQHSTLSIKATCC